MCVVGEKTSLAGVLGLSVNDERELRPECFGVCSGLCCLAVNRRRLPLEFNCCMGKQLRRNMAVGNAVVVYVSHPETVRYACARIQREA